MVYNHDIFSSIKSLKGIPTLTNYSEKNTRKRRRYKERKCGLIIKHYEQQRKYNLF